MTNDALIVGQVFISLTKGRRGNMPSKDLLRIYLRDHHAAAVAGCELAKRSAKSNAGTPFETLLDEIRTETAEDLAFMERIMELLGVTTAKGKDGALWMAEKMGRLKLNGSLTGYSPLSRVIEFEGLILNAMSTKGVWTALKDLEHPDLDGAELERLEERAQDQERRLNEARREAVRLAFAEKSSAL
jgi:hypothetical protein